MESEHDSVAPHTESLDDVISRWLARGLAALAVAAVIGNVVLVAWALR